jgi:hypothetical protein
MLLCRRCNNRNDDGKRREIIIKEIRADVVRKGENGTYSVIRFV